MEDEAYPARIRNITSDNSVIQLHGPTLASPNAQVSIRKMVTDVTLMYEHLSESKNDHSEPTITINVPHCIKYYYGKRTRVGSIETREQKIISNSFYCGDHITPKCTLRLS